MTYGVPHLIYRYIAGAYLRWLGILSCGLASIILIFDLIELFRRTATKSIKLSDTIYMAFLKLPFTFFELFAFVVLMSTWVVFFRLMRARELLVMRMSGLSVWHVLSPVLFVVFLIKVAELMLLSPLAASMHSRFEQMENRLIYGREDQITLSENGLWVSQTERSRHFILHAKSVTQQVLSSLTIYEFMEDRKFVRRFDAEGAKFGERGLILTGVACSYPVGHVESYEEYVFPSNLTYEQIQENSVNPSAVSFWKLPEFIRFLDKLHLSSLKYRLHWHTLIAQIFFVMSMVLLGAGSIFFQLGRRKVSPLLALTLGMGFLMFFIKDITQTLGLASTLPILMSAWIPSAVSWLVGAAMVLYCEDL